MEDTEGGRPMAGEIGKTIPVREALRRKTTKTKLENLPTEREDRFLRVEESKRPAIGARKMARFITTAATSYSRGKFIQFLGGFQKKDEKEIKGFVGNHEGVRGAAFRFRGQQVHYNVNRRISLRYNRVGLQEQLGTEEYGSAVGEELLLRIKVPHGRDSEMGPVTAEKILKLAQVGLSAVFSEDELDKNVRAAVALTVDENRVHDLVARGFVKDPEEMGIATETLAIDPRVVNG